PKQAAVPGPAHEYVVVPGTVPVQLGVSATLPPVTTLDGLALSVQLGTGTTVTVAEPSKLSNPRPMTGTSSHSENVVVLVTVRVNDVHGELALQGIGAGGTVGGSDNQ